MKKESKKSYILSSMEFATLLAGKGIKRTAIPGLEIKTPNPSQMGYLMNHLYQNKVIEGVEGKFKIEKELDEMLELIKSAQTVSMLKSREHVEDEIIRCLYGEEAKCIILEINEERGDFFRLSMDDMEHVREEFEIQSEKKKYKNSIQVEGDQII